MGVKMGFKKNITITLACVITECLIAVMPMIFIIYLFFMMDRISELFSTLLIVPYLILIINVLLILISFISQIFIKTKYYIKEKTLLVEANNKVREIKYCEIGSISYDFGDLIKFNARSSQLILFDRENQELLSINNPSIIMVHMIKKKCQGIKVCYYHNARFLYLLALINGLGVFTATFIKLLC